MFDQFAPADESRNGYSLTCQPLAVDDALQMASLFRAIGDPVRLRLLSLIACCPAGEVCVCDLSANFKLSAPTISHHLKVLRIVGLIGSERRGTWIYYRANVEMLRWLSSFLSPDDAVVVSLR